MPPLPSKIKHLLRQRNLLDKLDEIAKVPPINMKNSPLTTILLGALTLSVLASVVLCWLFIRGTQKRNAFVNQERLITVNRMVIGGLLQDTLEYSKTHFAITQTLESLGYTNKPAAK